MGKGKPKGVPHKIHQTVKQALTGAAERIGSGGNGLGGMNGFLERVGRDNPEFLAASIVRSCVPPANEEEPAKAGRVITVNILPVACANFFVIVDGHECLVDETAARLLAASGRAIAIDKPVPIDKPVASDPEPAPAANSNIVPWHRAKPEPTEITFTDNPPSGDDGVV